MLEHSSPATPRTLSLREAAGLTKPWKDPREDMARKLKVQPELFLVAVNDDRILGTVMAGYEGHRGYESPRRRPTLKGHGCRLSAVDHVEEALLALGCPTVNLQVRGSNVRAVAFYHYLGYTVDDTIDLGKRLVADMDPSTVDQ